MPDPKRGPGRLARGKGFQRSTSEARKEADVAGERDNKTGTWLGQVPVVTGAP
jgi:hypothetical protein